MPDLNDLLHSEQLKKMMGDQAVAERLKNAPECQQLLEILSRQANCDPERMVNDAAKGESQQLLAVIQKMLRDPESQKLLNSISRGLKL